MEVLHEILAWVSLLAGIASLVLAGYTIWLARTTERETREMFQRAEDRLREQYERTKDVLAAIETKSATIEKTVNLSQDHLLTTITNLVNETLIPKRQDPGEALGVQFMQTMAQNPDKIESMMKSLEGFAKLAEQQKASQK